MANNPGVMMIVFRMAYDANVMTLVDNGDQKLFGIPYSSDVISTQPYPYGWVKMDFANHIGDGVLANPKFQIKADAPAGEYPVTIAYQKDDIVNAQSQPVTFAIINATIVIKGNDVPHTHTLDKIAESAATCTKSGNREYYRCSDTSCGKYFKDAEGKIETTPEAEVIAPLGHSLSHHAAVEANCHAVGSVEYWACDKCLKNFSDDTGATEIADIVIPVKPDKHDGGTETKNAVAATEDKEGYTGDIFCLGCKVLLEKGSTIPKLTHSHSLSHHAAVEANCHAAGSVEYWACDKCLKNFSDDTGATEIADIVIPVKPDKHDGGIETKNAAAATEDKEGYTGDIFCLGCKVLLEKGSTIPKLTHSHNLSHHAAVEANCHAAGSVEY